MTSHLDLATIRLGKGAHGSPQEGVCLMEAVAWFADETHSDKPDCVSAILGAFGRTFNDALPDDQRQRLR